MGLKKRTKSLSEFNMSSLTDIIFLLLIFFMLTSNMVQVQPFELPKADSQTVAATKVVVSLEADGRITLNNVETTKSAIEGLLSQEVRKMKGKYTNPEEQVITIVAEVGTPFDEVVRIMKIGAKLKIRAIIATQPNNG